jgi:endonuclease G
MPRSPDPKKVFLVLMLAVWLGGCSFYADSSQNQNAPAVSGQNAAIEIYGNVSDAGEDQDNFLLIGAGSALSYNNTRGTANWIAWKTSRNDLGDAVQRPEFRPDTRLPSGLKRIVSTDYSGSGYDRGHLVPAADRFGSPEIFGDTFLMTNIVPQTASLNQFPWQQLESYVRGQVRRGWNAYQIAGVYGKAGELKKRVAVPTNCWKIVLFLRAGVTLDRRTRIIAVDMPNSDGLEDQNWQRFTTNIRSIEMKTGYNFFADLPADLQEILETRSELSFRKTK